MVYEAQQHVKALHKEKAERDCCCIRTACSGIFPHVFKCSLKHQHHSVWRCHGSIQMWSWRRQQVLKPVTSCGFSFGVVFIQLRRQAWARGLSPQMSLSPPPPRETYRPRIRSWIVRYFQILIVSAVNICNECLQTASASGVIVSPRPPNGASPLDRTGRLPSPDRLGYSPPHKWKFLVPPLFLPFPFSHSFHLSSPSTFWYEMPLGLLPCAPALT